jgi:FKBP-type peptidyl-prolyl cis-trans isomerase
MAKPHERVISLVLAVVFFATSVAAGVAVVFQIRDDNKQKSALNQIKDSTNQTESTTPQEGKLEGTKLANFTPIDKVEQLKIEDVVVGTGADVPAGATITAHYTGALAKDGTIFQSSHDTGQPVTFGLDQVIKGWTEGVPGMKVGGKRRLTIPAEMAYGSASPAANIPANSDLVFDIELVDLQQ